MKITKPLIRLNHKNKNGRIYSKESFENAIEEYQLKIDNGLNDGELGHPESDYTLMTPSNVSHKILDIKISYPKIPRKKKKKLKKLGLYKKDQAITTLELYEKGNGKVAKSIIKNLTPSPRGIGNIDDNGVVTNYQLISIDLIDKKIKA